ncbi:MAG: WD40 repeat domain-containing protein [Spirochaetales bacterium]|jgi:WD40 repeat protein|nr:WD40 repeat domain-containing protein [Spirochaetales bacterium]
MKKAVFVILCVCEMTLLNVFFAEAQSKYERVMRESREASERSRQAENRDRERNDQFRRSQDKYTRQQEANRRNQNNSGSSNYNQGNQPLTPEMALILKTFGAEEVNNVLAYLDSRKIPRTDVNNPARLEEIKRQYEDEKRHRQRLYDEQYSRAALAVRPKNRPLMSLPFGIKNGTIGGRYSPDGKRILISHESARGFFIKLLDAETGKELWTRQGSIGMGFSPGGRRILSRTSVSGKDMAMVLDAGTGRELLALPWSWDTTVSPDGKLILAKVEKTLKLWDAETGGELRTLSGSDGAYGWAFSPDGRRIAAQCSADNTVKVWDAGTGGEILSFSGNANIRISKVAFSPDGKRLFFDCDDKNNNRFLGTQIHDAANGRNLFMIPYEIKGYGLDGKQIFCRVSSREGSIIKILDAENGREIKNIPINVQKISSHQFGLSPDMKKMFYWSSDSGTRQDDGIVRIWNLGGDYRSFTLFLGSIHLGENPVAWRPDGKRLATMTGAAITIWDAETGLKLKTISVLKKTRYANGVEFISVKSIDWSPDGKRIVSGSGRGDDGFLDIWDAESYLGEGEQTPQSNPANANR